jgi:glycolate oxidase iron-sulfur subunit
MTATGHVHVMEQGPSEEDLARCVHCGFCLQACPTYLQLGMETESPRGRIQLARAVREGQVAPTPNVVQHFDLCLQCRACETACPSGVQFGRIMEDTRAMVGARHDRPRSWRLRQTLLRALFAAPWRLRLAFGALRLYQSAGIAPLLRRFLPRRLREMEATLPVLPRRFFTPTAVLGGPAGRPRATVALLTGCVMPLTYPRTHEATVRVLARNGCRVLAPVDQVCCGALHLHNGDPKAARKLARRNIDAFLGSGANAIIVNAAGCGSTMKEYPRLFAGDREYAAKAAAFAARVRDVTEFLAELPFDPPRGAVEARVTYQDSCHLVHAQKVREAPRAILRSVPGLELVEMAAPDRCCGSAGIYNLTQPEMSRLLLQDKMADVLSTSPDVIATANPGCMLQLELGVRQSGQRQEVVHVVELLDRAYSREQGQA